MFDYMNLLSMAFKTYKSDFFFSFFYHQLSQLATAWLSINGKGDDEFRLLSFKADVVLGQHEEAVHPPLQSHLNEIV